MTAHGGHPGLAAEETPPEAARPPPPVTDPTSQLWAEEGTWVFLLAVTYREAFQMLMRGVSRLGCGAGVLRVLGYPDTQILLAEATVTPTLIPRPGRWHYCPLQWLSCQRPGAPAEPSAGRRPPRRLQMVVAS